jgi:hypothetical protein
MEKQKKVIGIYQEYLYVRSRETKIRVELFGNIKSLNLKIIQSICKSQKNFQHPELIQVKLYLRKKGKKRTTKEKRNTVDKNYRYS